MKPKPVAIVDARNVLRSRWPNLSEDGVVTGCAAWAANEGAQAVVVFDGTAPGGSAGRHDEADCTVVGTGDESADDWIARTARELAAAGKRYWLITSDRELRERAGAGAERTIGGGTLARALA